MTIQPSDETKAPRDCKELAPLPRAIVEIGFIVFLFYSNLLMGEFTASNDKGKTWAYAFHDIVTGKNLAIAIVTAILGYLIFEALRKRL
jgi:hypothetical protein